MSGYPPIPEPPEVQTITRRTWAGTVIVPPPDGQVPPRFAGDPVTLALAWFPEDDYPLALARWPELTTEGAAKDAKDHADYNRALQRTLQGYADAGDSRLFIAPIRIPATWPGASSTTGTRPPPAPATRPPWPDAGTRP